MSPIQPEETVSSEQVYRGKLFSVRKERVRVRGGGETEREIVDHPDVIGVVPVLEDGRIVLVRQYRISAGRVLLEIPAGGIDEGETPEEAARREMVEETGYRVGALERLSGFYTSPGYTVEYMHLFLATDLRPGQPTESTDEIEVVEMPPAEVLQHLTDDEMADAKTQLGLLYYTSRLGRV